MKSLIALAIGLVALCRAMPTSTPDQFSLESGSERVYGEAPQTQTRWEKISDRLEHDFAHVLNLKDPRGEDAKQLVKYWKAKGLLFEKDQYLFEDLWPEPYRSERKTALLHEYQAGQRKSKNTGIIGKLIGRGKKGASSSSSQDVDTRKYSYDSDEDDPESTRHYCNQLQRAYPDTRYQDIVNEVRKAQLNEAWYYINNGFGDPDPNWKASLDEGYEVPSVYAFLYKCLSKSVGIEMPMVTYLMDTFGNEAFARNMLINDKQVQQHTAKCLWKLYQDVYVAVGSQ